MDKIRCIIVDDEELARDLIKTYISKIDYLECIGTFENPLTALSILKMAKPELLFLDIEMPDLRGTDFAELVSIMNTRIIFTTAYSEYAIKGFDLNALDYLLKPITFKRFLSAIEKYPKDNVIKKDFMVVKSGYDLHKIVYNHITFIESDSEYVHYHLTSGKKIIANQSLKKLEKLLPNNFMRVHRSYIVNKNKTTGLKGREIIISEIKLPVSDRYFETVKKELFNN
jgi:DNA-binding LytR/AlgR family response regulator